METDATTPGWQIEPSDVDKLWPDQSTPGGEFKDYRLRDLKENRNKEKYKTNPIPRIRTHAFPTAKRTGFVLCISLRPGRRDHRLHAAPHPSLERLFGAARPPHPRRRHRIAHAREAERRHRRGFHRARSRPARGL